jgi:drug/metabolite transporter (DMT)-like permease
LKKWIGLGSGVICISISAVFVKLAAVNGLASAFYRILFALVFVAPIYLLSKKPSGSIRNCIICIAGGICFGLELAFWNVSVMISSATIPTLLVNLSCIWVAIGATILFKEKTTIYHWLGTIIALIGVIIVVSLDQILKMRIEDGEIYAIIGSFFLAAYTLIIKQARIQIRTIEVLFYSLIGSLLPLIFICISKDVELIGFSEKTWFFLLCIGLITQVGGYFSINYALGHISSIKVSLITLFQPVLTAIFASIIISETIQRNKILGGFTVLFGLGVSFIRLRRKGLKI